MIDSYGRSLYQKVIINPILPIASSFSPLTLTCFALCAGVFILPLLAMHYSKSAFLALLISGFLDTLDGSIARYKNQTTPFGAALDITGDRIVEFSIIMGLYFFSPEERAINCLLMLGSVLFCITSFLVVGIFTQNHSQKGFHYSPGIIERTETFLLFSMMILFPAAFSVFSYLFIALVSFTALFRLWQFRKSSNV